MLQTTVLDYGHEIIKASDLMKMKNSAEKSNKTAELDSSSETVDTLSKQRRVQNTCLAIIIKYKPR